MNLKVIPVVSEPEAGWTALTGRIRRIGRSLISRNLPRRSHRLHYFICGRTLMVTLASHDLVALGVSHGRIHTERFSFV
jgi:3-phenylpropionate/trans-cinnamate dioxygenase ferredoxin reductase subunit